MYLDSRHLSDSRKGVSEVLGALLLIVVVVVAVASLASFIAVAQTGAQNRSAFLSSLKNENLQVVFAQFSANSTVPMRWHNLTLTIRNTNTASSQLIQVKAGSFWFPHWNEIDTASGHVTSQSYGVGNPPLLFPPKATTEILVNFSSSQVLLRNTSVQITLLTAAGNFFTTVYSPPTALGVVGVGSVNFQYYNRDIVTLDASQSQGSNGSQIVSYAWKVDVINSTKAGSCTASAFGTAANILSVNVFGRVGKFFPETFQNSTLQPLRTVCVSGPFRVTLSVADGRGLISNASSVIIPQDANMAPIATLALSPSNLSCAGSPSLSVAVQDVFGRGAPFATVLVSHTGTTNVGSSYTMGATGTMTISLTCSGPGTITFTINSLPSVTIPFS